MDNPEALLEHLRQAGVAGAFVGFHIAGLLALGGGLLPSVIAAAAGAVVVLFVWRTAKQEHYFDAA